MKLISTLIGQEHAIKNNEDNWAICKIKATIVKRCNLVNDDKNSDFMPKVDLTRDKNKLKYSDIIYMKQAEEVAITKALRYRNTRNKCAIAGFCLAGLVIGIYGYTIHAVRQETFLDDLYEPEKVVEKSTSNTSFS